VGDSSGDGSCGRHQGQTCTGSRERQDVVSSTDSDWISSSRWRVDPSALAMSLSSHEEVFYLELDLSLHNQQS
jgi:hypothetical protein